MKIAVYDLDDEKNELGHRIRRPWNELLPDHDVQFLSSVTEKVDSEFCVVFAHGSYLNAECVELFKRANPTIPLVVISGGDQQAWWQDGPLHYWRKQPVGKQLDLEFSACCSEFLVQLAAQPAKPLFSLLDPNKEMALAFRLLCEAKLFCGDSSGREANGIRINAPMTIQDWLSPFGKASDGDIDYVASLMGDKNTQNTAKAVLHAVVGKGDLNHSIRDFLDLLSKVEKV